MLTGRWRHSAGLVRAGFGGAASAGCAHSAGARPLFYELLGFSRRIGEAPCCPAVWQNDQSGFDQVLIALGAYMRQAAAEQIASAAARAATKPLQNSVDQILASPHGGEGGTLTPINPAHFRKPQQHFDEGPCGSLAGPRVGIALIGAKIVATDAQRTAAQKVCARSRKSDRSPAAILALRPTLFICRWRHGVHLLSRPRLFSSIRRRLRNVCSEAHLKHHFRVASKDNHSPSPRLRPKLQSMPPSDLATPVT